jgi:hypothetical protein
MIFLFIIGVASATNQTLCVVNYLNDFGYLNVMDNQISQVDSSTYKNALKLFQEYYNLEVDGELNNKTLELINMPRCGVQDDDVNFSTHRYKWNSKNVKWHYSLANQEILGLAEAAFEVWQQHTDLTFENDIEIQI